MGRDKRSMNPFGSILLCAAGALIGFGLAVVIVPILLAGPIVFGFAPQPLLPTGFLSRNGIHLNDEAVPLIFDLFLIGVASMVVGALTVVLGRGSKRKSN
jgi:hypothetical protein